MRAFILQTSSISASRSEGVSRVVGPSQMLIRNRKGRSRRLVQAESHDFETHADGSITFRFCDSDTGSSASGNVEDTRNVKHEENDRITNSKGSSSSTSSERLQVFQHRTGMKTARAAGRNGSVEYSNKQRSSSYERVGSQRVLAGAPASLSSSAAFNDRTTVRSRTVLADEVDGLSVSDVSELEESLLERFEIDESVVERLERIAQDEPKRRFEEAASKDVDVRTAESLYLLRAFSDLARLGQLDKAINLVEKIVAAEREDVLIRLRHKHFFRAAGERKAVKEAFRFVQVLPRKFVDARTYNMLVSVCVAAEDVKSAFAAADMYSSTGRKLDAILYTNLITACARVGNVSKAFEVYAEMKREGMKLDKHMYSSLINTCTRAIARTADRRSQLVLMERAFAVFDEMISSGVRADAAVWNAVITAAGKAGMVDRASQALTRMQTVGCKPNERTYTALVHAFANAGQKSEALTAYKKALREGLVHNLPLYAAAIGACANSHEADLETAMEVYHDLQRHCVQPDELLYGQLIVVAGKAGNVELAFQLLKDMEARGLSRSQETLSALILSCVSNKNIPDARKVYQQMRMLDIHPSMKACNALINAYGKAFRLGDVVALVSDMTSMGLRPDAYTYAAILNTCQRTDAAELAFEVVRVMKTSGIPLNECHCFILLRMCFNRLRAGWCVGGYPPQPFHPDVLPLDRSHEGRVLIEALAGYAPLHLYKQKDFDTSHTKWANRAIAVYRDTVAAGVQPGIRVLERLMACLRKERKQEVEDDDELLMDFKPERVILHQSVLTRMAKESWCQPSDVYDPRAVTLLEAAIFSGQLPQFKLDGKGQVDLRGLLPSVAEVYILSILSAMQRRASNSAKTVPQLKLLVPRYHPRNIFFPSYGVRGEEGQDGQLEPNMVHQVAVRSTDNAASLADEEESSEGSTTSLAVAGLLRNLGIRCHQRPEEGVIVVQPQELTRWVFRAAQCDEAARAAQPTDGYFSGMNTANHKLRRGLKNNLGPWRAPRATRSA